MRSNLLASVKGEEETDDENAFKRDKVTAIGKTANDMLLGRLLESDCLEGFVIYVPNCNLTSQIWKSRNAKS